MRLWYFINASNDFQFSCIPLNAEIGYCHYVFSSGFDIKIPLMYMFDIRWVNEIIILDTDIMTNVLMPKPEAKRPPIICREIQICIGFLLLKPKFTTLLTKVRHICPSHWIESKVDRSFQIMSGVSGALTLLRGCTVIQDGEINYFLIIFLI